MHRIARFILIAWFALLIGHAVWRVTHRWYFVSYQMVKEAE